MYIHLQNKMCRELESLEEKYRSGAEMSEGDLRRIDLLTHAMKSLATYIAMKEAEDYRVEQMAGQNYSGSMNSSYNQNGSYAPNNSYAQNMPYHNNSYGYQNNYGYHNEPPYHDNNRRW